MQKLAIRTGLRTISPTNGVRTGVRHDIQINHGLRKFFTTQVTKARVIHEMRELWLGHEIKLASAYYRPTIADIREEYSKAINLLTINEENRLKEKVTELQRKQDEISLLKYQHEMAMKKVFDDQLRMQSEFQKLEQAVNLTQN